MHLLQPLATIPCLSLPPPSISSTPAPGSSLKNGQTEQMHKENVFCALGKSQISHNYNGKQRLCIWCLSFKRGEVIGFIPFFLQGGIQCLIVTISLQDNVLSLCIFIILQHRSSLTFLQCFEWMLINGFVLLFHSNLFIILKNLG